MEVHQDFKGKKLAIVIRGVERIYLKLVKKERKKAQTMSTCNQLDLETLGSRPIMLKNLLGHWSRGVFGWLLGIASKDYGPTVISFKNCVL